MDYWYTDPQNFQIFNKRVCWLDKYITYQYAPYFGVAPMRRYANVKIRKLAW